MPYVLKQGLRWWAVRTRANFERTVAEQLEGKSYETFLPQYRTFSRRTDRKKIISLPLFGGYVFARTELDAVGKRVGILRARGVVAIIGGPDGPEPVKDHEIDSIRVLCSSDRMLEPWGQIEVGKQVRIVSGGLAGVTGVVVDVAGRGKRIICNVELLGRAVAAELRHEDLEVLGRFGPV
jgi:transcription antitermination factor NusG